MTAVVLVSVLLPGFWARLSVLLGLVFGFALSWVLDRSVGEVTGLVPATGQVAADLRVDLGSVAAAPWVGLPARTTTGPDGREIAGWHLPSFSLAFVLLVLPAVIALIAENTGHVMAVGAMTGTDLDPYLGRVPRRRPGHGAGLLGGGVTHHHVRREHRGHGRDPRLLHRRLLRRRGRGGPARLRPEARRASGGHSRRRARRDHRGPLRHDRAAGRQDLGGQPRRLRRPPQPGAPRGGDRPRRRQHQAAGHAGLLPGGHRPGDAGVRPRLPRGPRPRPRSRPRRRGRPAVRRSRWARRTCRRTRGATRRSRRAPHARGSGCSRKKRTISAEASGPCGSV